MFFTERRQAALAHYCFTTIALHLVLHWFLHHRIGLHLMIVTD
jgi:hypothetical protein